MANIVDERSFDNGYRVTVIPYTNQVTKVQRFDDNSSELYEVGLHHKSTIGDEQMCYRLKALQGDAVRGGLTFGQVQTFYRFIESLPVREYCNHTMRRD